MSLLGGCMTGRSATTIRFMGILILLTAQACSLASGPTPTATPEASSTPTATQTSAPTQSPTLTTEPTLDSPPPTSTEVVSETLKLSDEIYLHPENLFEAYPPVDWEITDDASSATFFDPDESGLIYLQVTNTGYELDEAAFENFVNAREFNLFNVYPGYKEGEREFDAAQRIASVSKTVLFNGKPQTIVTYYDQKGSAIYSVDFWVDSDKVEAYNPLYTDFFENITVDSSAAALLEPYAWVFTFTGPSNLYSIQVPSSWRYDFSEGEFALVETFYAPDDGALIQNVVYDNGTTINRNDAGKLALELLNNYYAADIIVTEDRIQPDGSERLTWYSPSGNYRGVSFLETRGTAFLLFTVMYDNELEDPYLKVLEYTVSSYSVP